MTRGHIAWVDHGAPRSSLYLIVMTGDGSMLPAEYRDGHYYHVASGFGGEIAGVESFVNDQKMYDVILAVYRDFDRRFAEGGER